MKKNFLNNDQNNQTDVVEILGLGFLSIHPDTSTNQDYNDLCIRDVFSALAESSFKKVWDTPEEDQAWQNL